MSHQQEEGNSSPNGNKPIFQRKRRKLELTVLENNEQQNLRSFLRTAKRHGTQMAINNMFGKLKENRGFAGFEISPDPQEEKIHNENPEQEIMAKLHQSRRDLEDHKRFLQEDELEMDAKYSNATSSDEETEDSDWDNQGSPFKLNAKSSSGASPPKLAKAGLNNSFSNNNPRSIMRMISMENSVQQNQGNHFNFQGARGSSQNSLVLNQSGEGGSLNRMDSRLSQNSKRRQRRGSQRHGSHPRLQKKLCILDKQRLKSLKKQRNKCLIRLDSKFKRYWDHLMTLLILYVAMISPFKISFIEDDDFPWWTYFDYFIDIFFFLDIVFTFFTPYYNKYELVVSKKKIASNYLSLWFWLDLTSIIPFELARNTNNVLRIFLELLQFQRLYRLLKVTKMLKTLRIERKGDTVFGRLLMRMSKSDSIFINILPIYAAGLFMAYMFSCLWHFVPRENPGPRSWLVRYGYGGESTHDKFWAAVYYIYSTITTTGYGDIIPNNRQEFAMTLFFMACGVTLNSLIFSTILSRIKKRREFLEKFTTKRLYLQQIKKKTLLLNGKIGDMIYKDMLMILDEAQNSALVKEKMPEFRNVRPNDVRELSIEVCERLHRFDKLAFFQSLPKLLWYRFYEEMERRVYHKGDIIFEKGAIANAFYVIRKGKVWFMQSEDKEGSLPFMEVDSYFGEFELFDNRKRHWTVMAATPCITYTITKDHLFKVFIESTQRAKFLNKLSRRFDEFEKADRECGRAICRINRVKQKIFKLKERTMRNALMSIEESKLRAKRLGKDDHMWHEEMENMSEENLKPKIEEARRKQVKEALQVLRHAHHETNGGDIIALGANLKMRRKRRKPEKSVKFDVEAIAEEESENESSKQVNQKSKKSHQSGRGSKKSVSIDGGDAKRSFSTGKPKKLAVRHAEGGKKFKRRAAGEGRRGDRRHKKNSNKSPARGGGGGKNLFSEKKNRRR